MQFQVVGHIARDDCRCKTGHSFGGVPRLVDLEQVRAPMYHLLLTLGSLGGLLSIAGWIWAVAQHFWNLPCLGSGIKGNSSEAKGLNVLVLALLASSDMRARRIQELEQDLQASRIVRVKAAISSTSRQQEGCQDEDGNATVEGEGSTHF